jgi:hypothetical protein
MNKGPASIGCRALVQPLSGRRGRELEAGKRKSERAFDMPEETDSPGTRVSRYSRQNPEFSERQGWSPKDISNSDEFSGNFRKREIQALPTKPATAWWCSLALPRARSIVFSFGAHADARSTLSKAPSP